MIVLDALLYLALGLACGLVIGLIVGILTIPFRRWGNPSPARRIRF